MLVTVMQVLDTSITNVALPHMQGSFSASIDEMSWVITSHLAANAVVIPASGWLTAVFGRRRFFLICTVTFTASSFLSGVALVTMLLARRSQVHQATLTSHLDPWSFEMAGRLRTWTDHFVNHGADTFTASRQAMAMLYRETVTQANILSYADDFWFLLAVYSFVLLLIPFMRRVRSGRVARGGRSAEESVSGARDPGLPAPAD